MLFLRFKRTTSAAIIITIIIIVSQEAFILFIILKTLYLPSRGLEPRTPELKAPCSTD